MATNWEEIATHLYEALHSFMAYDGYGKGGAQDGNRGNWDGADKAVLEYQWALRTMELPKPPEDGSFTNKLVRDQIDRRNAKTTAEQRFQAGVEEVHQQQLAEKKRDEISPGGSFPAHRINDRSPWERPEGFPGGRTLEG